MRLWCTARREVVPFEPGPIVTLYTCGITPYDATHLGHAAVYVTYDVLQRRLRDLGHETRCVRNITDVDDSILGKARELGVHYLDLAAAETARFDDDMQALGLLESWSEPRATSAIADIRGFIGMVLDRGHAYQAGGAVYFDVSSFPEFGSVSGYSREQMLEYAAERGGNVDDPHKRDPLDFVLWQPSLDDEPSWESLWGPGRPGWHIECSALALRELGTTIDLHGGGTDLIFPHHECERAQSEAATGEPFVRHWMHQAMVRMDGEKMSKSLGNLVFVSELRKEWDPMAIRLMIVENHYRTAWEWDDTRMPRAAERLERWRAAGEGDGALEAVRAALDDDLDAPAAIAAIDAAAAAAQGCRRRPPCSASSTTGLSDVRLTDSGSWGTSRPSASTASSTRSRGRSSRRSSRGSGGSSVSGMEHVPATGGAIFCPNHTSVIDSFFLPLVLPRRITFVGKAEYMDSWKTKYIFPAIGMIPIDRTGGDAAERALNTAARVHRGGRVLRDLPGGHPGPRRPAAPRPHRRRRGWRCAPARRSSPSASRAPGRSSRPTPSCPRPFKPAEVHFGRPIDVGRYMRPRRRSAGAPPDHRRGDVRDPRAHRPGVRRRVRLQEGGGHPRRRDGAGRRARRPTGTDGQARPRSRRSVAPSAEVLAAPVLTPRRCAGTGSRGSRTPPVPSAPCPSRSRSGCPMVRRARWPPAPPRPVWPRTSAPAWPRRP